MKTNKDYNLLKSNQKWFKDSSLGLEDALVDIHIMDADEVSVNNVSGWYAVVDTDGINAYFSTETEALAYRLFLINRILNG